MCRRWEKRLSPNRADDAGANDIFLSRLERLRIEKDRVGIVGRGGHLDAWGCAAQALDHFVPADSGVRANSSLARGIGCPASLGKTRSALIPFNRETSSSQP